MHLLTQNKVILLTVSDLPVDEVDLACRYFFSVHRSSHSVAHPGLHSRKVKNVARLTTKDSAVGCVVESVESDRSLVVVARSDAQVVDGFFVRHRGEFLNLFLCNPLEDRSHNSVDRLEYSEYQKH